MRVAELLKDREKSWRELDMLLDRIERMRGRRPGVADVALLGELYRSACADLMLAEAHDLPRDTQLYLHGLVGRAHNAVYRSRGFDVDRWSKLVFETIPRRLRADGAVRIAAATFFGSFLLCGLLAAGRPGLARELIGDRQVDQMEEMYSGSLEDRGRDDTMMAGFYIQHNASIGLQCFAFGVFLGIGSLYELLSNGIILGTVFGHMATTPHAERFYTFVTAHSSFELSAIVLAGAAGMRLGWGLIATQGQSRLASLRREATGALPIVAASVTLFILAAFIEGFISARSDVSYASKATIAVLSAAALAGYVGLCGRGPADATESLS